MTTGRINQVTIMKEYICTNETDLILLRTFVTYNMYDFPIQIEREGISCSINK
jgi:hypothetical protein